MADWNYIKWNKIRRRAAIEAMSAILSNDKYLSEKKNIAKQMGISVQQEVARSSILFAKALVEELKKDEEIFSNCTECEVK